MFATHPALTTRLKAIDPRFDPREIDEVRARLAAAAAQEIGEPVAPRAPQASLEALINLPEAAPAIVTGLVGSFGTPHLQLARDLRKSLPASIIDAGVRPASARALLLSLALDAGAEARERQKRFIAQQLGDVSVAMLESLQRDVDALDPEQRMPALLRTFPALRQLTRDERMQLMSVLNGMLQREGGMSIGSYVLRKLAQVQLRDEIDPAARVRRLPLGAVQSEAQVLFSVLALHGHQDNAAARQAYETGMQHLYPRAYPGYAAPENWARQLDVALNRLDQLAPPGKEHLIEAMVKTIAHDERLTIGEAELLRAVCATLHCPLPPLVRRAGDRGLEAGGKE
jgi:hypothetical protein